MKPSFEAKKVDEVPEEGQRYFLEAIISSHSQDPMLVWVTFKCGGLSATVLMNETMLKQYRLQFEKAEHALRDAKSRANFNELKQQLNQEEGLD